MYTKPTNTYKLYSAEEVEAVVRDRLTGMAWNDVAKKHNRTSSALQQMMSKYSRWKESEYTPSPSEAKNFKQVALALQDKTVIATHHNMQDNANLLATSEREHDIEKLESSYVNLKTAVKDFKMTMETVIEQEAQRRAEQLANERVEKLEVQLKQEREINKRNQIVLDEAKKANRFAIFGRKAE